MRLSLALACGILLGKALHIHASLLWILPGFLLLGLFWINRKYEFRLVIFWGICIHLIFVFIGIIVYTISNKKPDFQTGGRFCATVTEILQETPGSYQTVLNIGGALQDQDVIRHHEKIKAWFEKSPEAAQLVPGDLVLFGLSPRMIRNDQNPFEFDYRSYMARRSIFRQVYLPARAWEKSDVSSEFSITVQAEKARLRLLRIFRQHIHDKKALHILSALILGYKRGLDTEIKQTFAAAGAMHVLAVSGLHTGIIFLLMSFFLGSLRKHKTGRWVFVVIMLAVLWCFAFITGLSPSVKRAATMFGFVAVGEGLRRQSNIYNTLSASAFFLLLFHPNDLFEVGFQLSYSAVWGIVWLQPRLDRLVPVSNRILRYGWNLVAVTASAQVATFPLSVYYFNQFPVYGCLSNLLVIPAVTLLIPLGAGLLIFSGIPEVVSLFAKLAGIILRVMIHALEWIENIPFAVMEFSLSTIELIFLFCTLCAAFLFIETTQKRFFKAMLFFLWCLIFSSLAVKVQRLFTHEMIVYHSPDPMTVHLITGRKNYIVSEEDLPEDGMSKGLIDRTVSRLCLDDPVFLRRDTFYCDSRLFLKHGVICFEGKTIVWGREPEEADLHPQYLIGQYDSDQIGKQQAEGVRIISSHDAIRGTSIQGPSIFSLSSEGAFREKW